MPVDAEQTDSSGKYTFGAGAASAKKYWPTIMKSIEVVSTLVRRTRVAVRMIFDICGPHSNHIVEKLKIRPISIEPSRSILIKGAL